MLRQTAIVALLLTPLATWAADFNDAEFFEAKIRPVLVAHCYECHAAGAEQLGGELRLDSREGTLRGGESGPAVEPGDPDNSLLLAAIRYQDLEMPPTGKLSDRVAADFEQWIRRGAHDPRESPAPIRAKTSPDLDAARDFWSFRSPESHAPPHVRDQAWPRRKIDRFVLARLEAAGLSPAPGADRRALIRRLTFDLTGLPPAPEQVARFVDDDSPRAYEQLVDQLMASPRFGERWARLWLDVARYAEDQAHIVGSDKSLFYPNAFLYRDWLVQSFNEDLPFDRFAKLQLAADLIEPAASEQHVALGFLGLGPKYYRRKAPEVMADEWEDRVDTVTRGFLALTVACARCHDHKYDPIPTEDYYGLAGVFASTEMFNRPLEQDSAENASPAQEASDDKKPTAKVKAKKKRDTDTIAAMHIVKEGEPRDLRVHIRGDVTNQGDVVPRHFPQVAAPTACSLQEGSGRRELAEAIASDQNPLTARVIVNRIWGQYFGRPLVATPSNFGQLGDRPSHPELLDDLAVRFMRSGWSLKWLHREIVLSATYQQSSRASAEALQRDPANQLLGRMNRRRLSVEMWRDALLSVCGKLDDQLGGESLDVQDPAERRRSVYSSVSRLELNPLLSLFDFPDPNVHAARRVETTTPLQKLFVLNSPFMVRRAEDLAARLDAELPAADDAGRIQRAYALLYARPPTPQELELGVEFVTAGGDAAADWRQYAQILLAANENLYID